MTEFTYYPKPVNVIHSGNLKELQKNIDTIITKLKVSEKIIDNTRKELGLIMSSLKSEEKSLEKILLKMDVKNND